MNGSNTKRKANLVDDAAITTSRKSNCSNGRCMARPSMEFSSTKTQSIERYSNQSIINSRYETYRPTIDHRISVLPLPYEILIITNAYLSQNKINQTIEFLEDDLMFWLHSMGVNYEWITINYKVRAWINWPHPIRLMRIPILATADPLEHEGLFEPYYEGLNTYEWDHQSGILNRIFM
jgi:hypothetical protein